MKIGLLTLHIRLPGSLSLKAKRSRIKPLIAKMQKQFNISVAEIGQLDQWQSAILACALVSNDGKHVQKSMERIVQWLESEWRDVDLVENQIEIID